MFFQLKPQKNGIIRLRYVSKPESMEEFEVYLNALKDLYTPKKPFSLLIDTRELSGFLSWKYLKRQADFMGESEPLARKYLHRLALVVTSPLVKTLIQTIFLIKAPVTPTETFHDDHFAETWAVTRLPSRGELQELTSSGEQALRQRQISLQKGRQMSNSTIPREYPRRSPGDSH